MLYCFCILIFICFLRVSHSVFRSYSSSSSTSPQLWPLPYPASFVSKKKKPKPPNKNKTSKPISAAHMVLDVQLSALTMVSPPGATLCPSWPLTPRPRVGLCALATSACCNLAWASTGLVHAVLTAALLCPEQSLPPHFVRWSCPPLHLALVR